ncbi:MAG TPA: SusC/RagA family TonB-linked outer membrane protein [Cyclobacteriaceae bacterium]|jgi:TonB-linked SusC/RagA family outer membrane protein|nr:SusC/RagA family TonB-linked outer membrane protein [Cyclobacteriaceae bacterium]
MRKFLLMCFAFGIALSVWAQDRVVTGRVTSAEDGTALPGVNVVIKGTTNGTVTDTEGKYSLSVPASANVTIAFSFIGLKTVEIAAGDKSVVDVQLGVDITQLSEVVVTGLNIQRESKNLGYSVATVKNEVINQAKVTNLAAALSGKVSGLQINQTSNSVSGGDVRIVLRGNRSFLGNNQALVVLDGVQVDNTYLNSINPNDVENVTVLKGANAAALYGSQASNGVLVITTKSGGGKKGGAPEITFSNTTQLNSVSYIPKLQTRFGMNGGEGPGADSFNVDPNYGFGYYIPYENQNYGPEFNGQLVQLGRPLQDGRTQMVTYENRYNDHLKFWDVGVNQQNDLSFSMGTENSHYYVSVQDVQNNGIVPKDQYRRDVFRFNGDTKYGIFKTAYKVAYTVTSQNVYSNWNGSLNNNLYWSWMNVGMSVPLTQYKDWKNNIWASPTGWYDDFFENPYFVIDQNRLHQNRQDFLGSLDMSVQATKWLSFTARGGLTNYVQHDNYQVAPKVYDLTLANPNKTTAAQSKSTNGVIPGATGDYYTTSRRVNADFMANISHSFNQELSVTGVLGFNIFDDYYTDNSVYATALAYSDPQIYNVAYRSGILQGTSQTKRYRRESVYADAAINWRYLTLHGDWRNDWISLLAPGNWSFSYPEVDLAFRFTDAIPALKENRFINFGKITASYGKTGNVNVDPYQLKTPINAGTPFNVPVMYLGGGIVTPSLMPEFTLSKEVGIELGLWEERISAKANYYETNTTNQTVPFQVSTTTGYSSALVNVGEMLNQGLEFDLSVTPLKTASGLAWTVGGNFTDVIANTPTYIYQDANGNVTNRIQVLNNSQNGTNSYATVGYNYPTLFTTDWARVPDGPQAGRVIVDPVSGLPTRNPNLVNLGQTNPRYRLGLTTNVSWKGISLSILLDYRAGNVIYNQFGQNIEFGGIGYKSAQAGRQRFVYPNSAILNSDGTYSANTNVTVQEGNYNFWQSTFNTIGSVYVTSAAFWKLRELSLSYQIPSAITQKIKLKSARVSVVARNLFMWRPKSNQWTDPEFSNDTSNGTGTVGTNILPPVRTYGANVTLTF